MNTSLSLLLLDIVFLTIIFLHLARKNVGAALAYGVQSLAIAVILLQAFFQTNSLPLLLLVVVIITIKVVLAPLFFVRLIKKHRITFSVSTYLNTPLTLLVLAGLTALVHSQRFTPLTTIVMENQALLALAFSGILLSLFLIINRKGALSQILGVLSLENSIVVFAIFAGLEQSPALQLGIIFDILAWLGIATVFASMIYRHFGSIDVSSMTHLRD